jgi:hypothetical protein
VVLGLDLDETLVVPAVALAQQLLSLLEKPGKVEIDPTAGERAQLGKDLAHPGHDLLRAGLPSQVASIPSR